MELLRQCFYKEFIYFLLSVYPTDTVISSYHFEDKLERLFKERERKEDNDAQEKFRN